MIIAIDGPAGAGKSTIAKAIAKALNITYLDTGAMYRAAGLKAHMLNADVTDAAAVESFIKDTKIEIYVESGETRVLLDGRDVTSAIREHHISKLASDISALPIVRYKMVELQREIAQKTATVLDGRDIGTFVLPNADYKFFLTASADERARRRVAQLKRAGTVCDFETVKRDIEERDRNDSERALAPLKKADDAIEIDTTHLNIDEVVDKLLSYIRG